MIYLHEKYTLDINRDKGKFYINDQLVFHGFAFKALKMFVGNCNDNNVNKHFKLYLTMRENCRFKGGKNDKEKSK